MSTYAKNTSTPTEKTRMEIERTLIKYGATKFVYGFDDVESAAVIGFSYNQQNIRFNLPLPKIDDFAQSNHMSPSGHPAPRPRTPEQQREAWEQASRSKWRALLLIIKAKLEAAASGITTLEREFFADTIATPDGQTVYEWYAPQVEQNRVAGRMPPLLPGFAPRKELE